MAQLAKHSAQTDVRLLHPGNSGLYRPKPVEKKATIRWERAEYALEWGRQSFDGPHMVVEGPGGRYGVDLAVFFSTHEPCPHRRDHYIKSTRVRAVQVEERTELHTWVRERLEGTSQVEPGGWIVQNPSDELYYNTAEEFAQRYEAVADDEAPTELDEPWRG